MRRVGPVLVPLLTFVLGCAAAAPFVVPSLSAQQQHVQRWEYYCIIQGSAPLTDVANHLGAEGWEMCGATVTQPNVTWCFKRPR